MQFQKSLVAFPVTSLSSNAHVVAAEDVIVMDEETLGTSYTSTATTAGNYTNTNSNTNNITDVNNNNNKDNNTARTALNRYGDDVMHYSQVAAYDNQNVVAPPDDETPPSRRRTFQMPEFTTADWIGFAFAAMFVALGFGLSLYFFLRLVPFDVDWNVKPFKGVCTTSREMDDNLCFLSCGQISRGIVCFGQVNIGLICIGQANVALLFGFGQAAFGWGYSVGQFACGTYVPVAQVAFALYRVGMVQLGLQLLVCFFSPIALRDNKPLRLNSCE